MWFLCTSSEAKLFCLQLECFFQVLCGEWQALDPVSTYFLDIYCFWPYILQWYVSHFIVIFLLLLFSCHSCHFSCLMWRSKFQTYMLFYTFVLFLLHFPEIFLYFQSVIKQSLIGIMIICLTLWYQTFRKFAVTHLNGNKIKIGIKLISQVSYTVKSVWNVCYFWHCFLHKVNFIYECNRFWSS